LLYGNAEFLLKSHSWRRRWRWGRTPLVFEVGWKRRWHHQWRSGGFLWFLVLHHNYTLVHSCWNLANLCRSFHHHVRSSILLLFHWLHPASSGQSWWTTRLAKSPSVPRSRDTAHFVVLRSEHSNWFGINILNCCYLWNDGVGTKVSHVDEY